MATKTLNKFGVRLHNSGIQQMGQPKAKNRFRVLLFGFGAGGQWNNDAAAIAVETDTVTKPKLTFNSHEMHMFDSVASYSGKHQWGEIELVVKDTVDNSPLKAMANHIQKQRDHHRRMAPREPTESYKFEMWIQTMSGEKDLEDQLETVAAIADKYVLGNDDGPSSAGHFTGTLDTWVCQGCMVTDYDFGSLDYSDSNYNTATMTIKPDHCFLLDDKGKPMAQIGGGLADTLASIAGGVTAAAGKVSEVTKGLF